MAFCGLPITRPIRIATARGITRDIEQVLNHEGQIGQGLARRPFNVHRASRHQSPYGILHRDFPGFLIWLVAQWVGIFFSTVRTQLSKAHA